MSRKLAVLGGEPLFREPMHVGRPNLPDAARFSALVGRMMESRWFTNYGPLVREFQEKLEALLGVRHCLPVCNGTIALELAYRALDLQGEVILPSFTFIATAHALQWQGITPVFCDMLPGTCVIDPDAVEEMITPRTTGIVGVHAFGNPCDFGRIDDIAVRHGLKVVYDAAHAFGNEVGGAPICTLGPVSVLSFHATKFFSTFEGGAIVTDDDHLYEKLRLMMNFGFAGRVKDSVDYIGTNGKMTEICAAMGIAMLDRVEELREVNRRNFEDYRACLTGLPGIELLEPSPRLTSGNMQYVIVEISGAALTRDQLVAVLEAENVLARRYFYPGCHRMKPYCDNFPSKGRSLPVTERVSEQLIALPTGESVDAGAIRSVAGIIASALSGDSREIAARLEGGRDG